MTEKDNTKEIQNKEDSKASFAKEFLEFIKKYGVLGLAIGVITGTAVKSLVDNFVLNIINPVLGRLVSADSLTTLEIFGIKYGAFLNELINFVILMLIVFIFIRFFLSKFIDEEDLKKIK
jgi:large conductance mechanosensitive channel